MNKKTTTAIVPRRETESLVPDAKNLSDISRILLDSGMWPKLKANGVPGVFAVIEYGRELGIPPVAALNTIVIVNGRLTMEAKAMLAVANQRAGVTWGVESTNKGCTITFSRPGFQPLKSTFDELDAKAAGLSGKDNWKAYPKDMYFARAAARGIRQIAPDAVLGLYLPEEVQDFIMPAAGDIVEVRPEPEPETEKKKEPEKETPAKTVAETKPTTKPTPEPKPETKTKPTEQAKPPTTPVKDDKERVIENIKGIIALKTFDPKHFKIFLYDFAKDHKVKFVENNQFKNLSFHEGDYNDLKKLLVHFDYMAAKYLEWEKAYQPQPEEGGGTGEEEPPF
jgi:hypothetical protein